MTRYDCIYWLSLPALGPYLLWRRVRRGKYAESAGGMLGRRLPDAAQARRFAAGSLWIHAVSVGEVAAAQAVAPGLRALAPELPLVVSTITETGQAAARRAFAPENTQAALTYFPLDLSGNVRRFQAIYNPKIFVLLETELWPNFLSMAATRGTKCFMMNGRLSDRSFPRNRRFKRFLRPALAALAGVCVQTPLDAARFAALGVAPERIRVTGNCKFDLAQRPLSENERREMMTRFGMNAARRWIVAGSTHHGEEALILRAFAEVRRAVPQAGLVLCPRHPDRFAEAGRLAREAGFSVGLASAPMWSAAACRRSEKAQAFPSADLPLDKTLPTPREEAEGETDAEVVILDQMGVLARAYGLGEFAIVAGSFCPVGGHNLLEAAAHGVPVLFGPDMHSQREIHRLFLEAAAGTQIEGEALAGTIIGLLRDGTKRQTEGEKCLKVVEHNRGNAERAVEAVRAWLRA